MTEKEFDIAYAETLRYCQIVEHDVKMILALLQEGNPEENLIAIENERNTLGEIIHAIRDLDHDQQEPFFTPNDYRVLRSIRDERNHFVHQAYAEFLYDKTGTKYPEECARLQKFHDNMVKMARATQHARLYAAKKFKK